MPLRLPVDEPEAARRIGDRNIVGDREVGHQREFLEHADDAGLGRIGRFEELLLHTFDGERAAVGSDDAGHDLDEGRLPRPVLAEDGVNGPAPAGEVDALEGASAREIFGNPGELRKGGYGHSAKLPDDSSGPHDSDGKGAGRQKENWAAPALQLLRRPRERSRYEMSDSSSAMIAGPVIFTPQGGNSFTVKKLSGRSDQ